MFVHATALVHRRRCPPYFALILTRTFSRSDEREPDAYAPSTSAIADEPDGDDAEATVAAEAAADRLTAELSENDRAVMLIESARRQQEADRLRYEHPDSSDPAFAYPDTDVQYAPDAAARMAAAAAAAAAAQTAEAGSVLSPPDLLLPRSPSPNFPTRPFAILLAGLVLMGRTVGPSQ